MNLAGILEGKDRITKIIKFPGTEHDISMQILTIGEDSAAQYAGEKYFKDLGIKNDHIGLHATYLEERTWQRLWRVFRNVTNGDPLTASVEDFKKHLTVSVATILINTYEVFEMDMSPNPINLTDDELTATMELLKKKPEAMSGDNYSTNTQKQVITSLAKQLVISLRDNSLKSLPLKQLSKKIEKKPSKK